MHLPDMLRYTLAGAICILGLLHSALATQLYETLNLAALWFVSGGIAMVCVGLGNLHPPEIDRRQLTLLALQNAAMLAFFVTVWFVFPAIQVAAGIAIFSGLLFLCLNRFRQATTKQV